MKVLLMGAFILTAAVATATDRVSEQTVSCDQGAWNLSMQVEGPLILSAHLESGDYVGAPMDVNDITYAGGSEAYVRTDVEYEARGPFSNCHTL